MSNFQVPNYCHYYNPNGGKKICYLLMAGHADGIFVDGWLCWVQFRSHGSDIGHVNSDCGHVIMILGLIT